MDETSYTEDHHTALSIGGDAGSDAATIFNRLDVKVGGKPNEQEYKIGKQIECVKTTVSAERSAAYVCIMEIDSHGVVSK